MASTIPPDFKKSVAFVFMKGPDDKLVPIGTAFFVALPIEDAPERAFIYLVTARHVLTKVPDATIPDYVSTIFLRLDRRAGGTETFEIPVRTAGANQTVFLPSDPTVDLAVLPVLPDPQKLDFKCISIDHVTSEEQFRTYGISEGSEVFFTGLFTPHVGLLKNYPVVRFGRVALLTDEKVNWNGTPTDLYLVESASFGGNSGSPVFYFLGSDRIPGSLILGPAEIRLAGVMKGAFREGLQVIQTAGPAYSLSNLGIAAVVPSYKLRDLLLSEPVRRARQKPTRP